MVVETQTAKQPDPFDVRTRQRQHKEKMVDYLGELLIPVTEGFDQVNLDMTFTFLGNFEEFC